MNMSALMAQAKKLQNTLEKTTKEIEEKEFNYSNENINIIMTGDYRIKKIEIINNALLSDTEILEDIITVGINSIVKNIKKEKDDKLGKYTNGLGGLF